MTVAATCIHGHNCCDVRSGIAVHEHSHPVSPTECGCVAVAERKLFRVVGLIVKVEGISSLRAARMAARYYDVNDGYRHTIEQSDDGGKTWTRVED